jgi:AraC family transcriptional regulator
MAVSQPNTETAGARQLAPGEFICVDVRQIYRAGVICLSEAQPPMVLHEHADTHFVFVPTGVYETDALGADGFVGPNSALLSTPGAKHRDRFRGPGRAMALSLSDELLNACLGEASISEQRAGVIESPLARSVLSAIAAEAMQPDALSGLAIEGYCFELAAALAQPSSRRAHQAPGWLARSRERVANDQDVPTVEQLAREAGVHPVHFARVFRRHVGLSPVEYLRRERAKRAADLLAHSLVPIVEVGLACGFADQPAFSKAFRRATGVTPASFRRRWLS